ncbi:alginate lyase family protein [Cronobacter dublinensis]
MAAGHPKENYSLLFNDAAAEYALALDWRLSGDDSRAKRAVYILTQWAEKLRSIDGTSDKYLAAGLYGYQLAVAAETLRGTSAFSASQQKAVRNMLVTVFAPMDIAFLEHHNGEKTDHYWANWDLSSTASLMAIGIYADRKDFYEKARHYYLDGNGNGALRKAAWKVYPDGLVQ